MIPEASVHGRLVPVWARDEQKFVAKSKAAHLRASRKQEEEESGRKGGAGGQIVSSKDTAP